MFDRVLALPVILCIAAAVPAAATEIDKHFHQSFEVAPGARLHLEHGDGEVTVRPWDRDVVDVDVRYRATVKTVGFSSRGDFDVEFGQSAEEIRVIGREPGGFSFGFHSEREHEYRYTIRAPAWLMLDLQGDDGSVSIEGWDGRIECSLNDGDVSLSGVSSDGTRLALDDGDVVLENCDGDFEISTSDGDIDLRRQGDGKLRLRADDGDVRVGLVGGGAPDVSVETDDGMVVIELAPGAPASFELESDDGEIDLRVPEESLRVDRGKYRTTGQIHGGAGLISARTEEGDIRLRSVDR